MPNTLTTYIQNIDVTFPIQGQDNPSQGFRDNFFNIEAALSSVATDLMDLQASVAVTNASNDFGGYVLSDYISNTSAQSYINLTASPGSGTYIVDSRLALYQKISVNGNTLIYFSDWPNYIGSRYVFNLEIVSSDGGSYTVTFAALSGTLKKDSSFTNPITVSNQTDGAVFELSSVDGGTSQRIRYVSGPFVSV